MYMYVSYVLLIMNAVFVLHYFLCILSLYRKMIIGHFLLPPPLSAQFRPLKFLAQMTRSVSRTHSPWPSLASLLTYWSQSNIFPKSDHICLVSFKDILWVGQHDPAPACPFSPSHALSFFLNLVLLLASSIMHCYFSSMSQSHCQLSSYREIFFSSLLSCPLYLLFSLPQEAHPHPIAFFRLLHPH